MQLERSCKVAVRSSSCRAVAFSYNLDQASKQIANMSQSPSEREPGWTLGTSCL